MRTVGEKLAELRGEKSQKEVADAVGVAPSSISMYEQGERIPSDSVKVRIAKFFGVSVADLFFDEK